MSAGSAKELKHNPLDTKWVYICHHGQKMHFPGNDLESWRTARCMEDVSLQGYEFTGKIMELFQEKKKQKNKTTLVFFILFVERIRRTPNFCAFELLPSGTHVTLNALEKLWTEKATWRSLIYSVYLFIGLLLHVFEPLKADAEMRCTYSLPLSGEWNWPFA